MNIDIIYIIVSAEFEKDRLNYLQNYFQINNIDIPIKYYEPFYKNRDEHAVDMQYYTNLNIAEIMLFCTYEKMFEEIIEKKYKYILTLESDVLFCDNFNEKLNTIFKEWVERAEHPSILFIGNGVNRGYNQKAQISDNLFEMNESKCTDSMIFDYDSIKYLADKIKYIKNNGKLSNAVDRVIDHCIGLDILSYWIKEPIIIQGSQNGTYDSTIHPIRRNLRKNRKQRLAEKRKKIES